jgi:hypothetical protein
LGIFPLLLLLLLFQTPTKQTNKTVAGLNGHHGGVMCRGSLGRPFVIYLSFHLSLI